MNIIKIGQIWQRTHYQSRWCLPEIDIGDRFILSGYDALPQYWEITLQTGDVKYVNTSWVLEFCSLVE